MTVTITWAGVFQFILAILGIVVSVLAISILSGVQKTVKTVYKIIDNNQEQIDATIKQAPEVMTNIRSVTRSANDIIVQNGPNVYALVEKAKNTVDQANSITQDVADTVYYISETAVDAATGFKSSISSATDSISRIIDLVDIFRREISKRR